jgi:hypothetical protein
MGQGSRMSVNVSPSTATIAMVRAFQCGWISAVRINFREGGELIGFVAVVGIGFSGSLAGVPEFRANGAVGRLGSSL